MPLRSALHLPSVRDLLALIMSFSLLSLYLTYHLGFSAGRLHTVDGSRQDALAYRDSHVGSPFRSPQLLDLLFKLERRQMWTGQLLAVIRGRRSLLQHVLRFYSSVLRSHGFSVRAEDTSVPNTSKTDRLTNWTLLLCFAFSDGDPECFSRTEFLGMRPLQRVNRIPGIQSVLWRRSGLCRTVSQLSALPALVSRPITPACFALPEQHEEFLNTADGAGFNISWLLKPSVPEGKLEHISTMEFFNRVRLKEFPDKQELLVQQFLPNQLHILGFPVSFQLFVLVTSVAPLRAYLYGEGIVSFRHGEENGFRKIPGKWWLMSQLWQHVAATQGRNTVRMALDNTDILLVHLLLGAEAFLLVQIASRQDSLHRCENCFQLLAVELMYNSSFYPVVLGVNGQPSLGLDSFNMTVPSFESGSSRTQHSVRQSVFSDTLKLLFAKDSVHRSVFDSLQMAAEAINSGVTGLQCLISHDLCLTEDDLASLLASRREMQNTGRFRRLYPTVSGNRYSGYLQELQALMLQDSSNIFQPVNSLFRETLRHSTADLHGIQTRLEQILNPGSSQSFLEVEPEPGVEDDYSYPSDNLLSPSFDVQSEQSPKIVHEQDCSQGLLALSKSHQCTLLRWESLYGSWTRSVMGRKQQEIFVYVEQCVRRA